MNMTAQEIITAAYRKISIEVGNDSDRLNSGLQDLQNMLSLWSVDGLNIPNYVEEILTLTAGQSAYSIGEDGSPDFNTQRPVRLVSGFIRIDEFDYPLNIRMTQFEYAEINSKSLQVRPREVYYDPQYPNAFLQFDYQADSNLEFFLTSEKELQNPVSLGTEFSIPLEYNEPIIYNLATRFAPDNNTNLTISAAVALLAEQSLDILKKYNAGEILSRKVKLDPALVFGTFSRAGTRMDIKRGY